MYHFDETKFIPINIDILRRSGVAPCECFLLLKSNDHLIPFLKEDQPIPISKLRKIHSKEQKCMYIQIENKEKYTSYLSQLFSTEDGQNFLQSLEQQNPGEPIYGIPKDYDIYLFLKKPAPTEMAVAATENENLLPQKVELAQFLQDQSNKLKNVFDGKDKQVFEKLYVHQEVQSLLTALKRISGSSKPTSEIEIKVINNATDYIQTRMLILSKRLKELDPEFHQKIASTLQKSQDNFESIQKLRSSNQHIEQYSQFKSHVFALETHLRVIGKRSAESCEPLPQLINETIGKVVQAGNQILTSTGQPQNEYHKDTSKDDLILKLSKLVRKQAEMIGKLTLQQSQMKLSYENLKKTVETSTPDQMNQNLQNDLQGLELNLQSLQTHTNDIGRLSAEMDQNIHSRYLDTSKVAGITENDLESLGLKIAPLPRLQPIEEILNVQTQVIPSDAEKEVAPQEVPAKSSLVEEFIQSQAAQEEENIQNLDEEQVQQTSSASSEIFEKIVQNLDQKNVELINSVKQLDADRSKMINILANEKRHRQKMTQSLTEEKQKLKDISSKLLERDLKLKEIQTQLNNLKTQFKVETQKREQLEADLVKKLEDENQYKMEIAKLRMKGLKSA
jgi:hypothetical protein